MDRLNVFPGPAEVALASARAVAKTLSAVVTAKGRCRFALAGGSTPRATYEQLALPSVGGSVDWTSIDVFFGDERMVPPEDAASNYRMAREALLERVPIPAENVRRISGEAGADEAARRYVADLGDEPLDIVLLGMGEDGHVASLFPGSRVLEAPFAPAMPSKAPVPPHSRVTLSLPAINSASEVLLIVTGPGKAACLREVFGERRSRHPVLPAARVGSATGGAQWFVDAAAASLLEEVIA